MSLNTTLYFYISGVQGYTGPSALWNLSLNTLKKTISEDVIERREIDIKEGYFYGKGYYMNGTLRISVMKIWKSS